MAIYKKSLCLLALVLMAATGPVVEGQEVRIFQEAQQRRMCLDVKGGEISRGAEVILFRCGSEPRPNQTWTFEGDELRIGGRCLDARGGQTEDRTPVIVWDCHGGTNQKWRQRRDGSIQGPGDKCLDVQGGGTENGTPIILFRCHGGANQRWTTAAVPSRRPPVSVVGIEPSRPIPANDPGDIIIAPNAGLQRLAVVEPLAPRSADSSGRTRIQHHLRLENSSDDTLLLQRIVVKAIWPDSEERFPVADRETEIRANAITTVALPRHVVSRPAPRRLEIELFFRGFWTPVTLKTGAVAHNVTYGFPAKAEDLAQNEYWHSGNRPHRVTREQVFAYDFSVAAWDPDRERWALRRPGTTGDKNEDYLIWDKPVYAIAAGEVIFCQRDLNDNEPGTSGSGGGNNLAIRHQNGDIAGYSHFKKDSIPRRVCSVGQMIRKGRFLGNVGNSGQSSNPHLHLHVERRKTLNGRELDYGWPLLFEGIEVIGQEKLEPDEEGPWAVAEGAGLEPRMLIHPARRVASDCDGRPGDPGCDCLQVDESCDFTADGCYPDGPGSYGAAGAGTSPDPGPGLYCPDHTGEIRVCGLRRVRGQIRPACQSCPDLPAQGRAGYGCPCNSDRDCAERGVAGRLTLGIGQPVELACWGSPQDGWAAGPGVCLPSLDSFAQQAEVEEFERTRWLCKTTPAALQEATREPYACLFNQQPLDLFTATAVTEGGCDGMPAGDCEASGRRCDPDTSRCVKECDPNQNRRRGNPTCAAWGYPPSWTCTDSPTKPRCMPPFCDADPPPDLSFCQQFLVGG